MMVKNWLWLIVATVCLIGSLLLASRLQAANVSYVYDELNRIRQAIYDDGKIVNYTYDKAGNRRVKEIAQLQETVSPPTKPTGPTDGTAEVSYSYSTGRSSSDLGHPIQYLFDWGDGTESGWLPAGQKGEKAWATPGHYEIKVQARCASHDFVLSAWSEVLSVDIVPIQIDLQFPSNEAAFNCCSMIPKYQPSFGWTVNWTFPQYTILLSTSPTDFTTQGVLVTKATLAETAHNWIPTATLWKTILTLSHNKGNVREIYWKVIGTKADKKTVESPVRSFGIGDTQKVTIVAPSNNAVLPPDVIPSFEFNSNCNSKFTLEISPFGDFKSPVKIRSFAFTTKDPNVEAVVKRTLTYLQWTSVKTLIGKEKSYFRIKAWDGLNRETVSETRSFTIQ
jgi:YD repeat-containing protein